MATLLTPPKIQFFDINGDVLSGGEVYFYAAGTSTPQDTYADKDKTTTNANPVVLDSRGEATVYLDTADYKVVVKDSSGNTIWTEDNVRPNDQGLRVDLASTASGVGAELVSYKQDDVGSVNTTVDAKLKQRVTPEDFGAVRDGVTDDSTAFQNALDSGKDVYLSPGTYRLNANIAFPSGGKLIGPGPGLCTLENDSNDYLFTLSNNLYSHLSGFQLKSVGADGADKGIKVQQTSTNNSLSNVFRDIWFNGNTRASFATTTQIAIEFVGAAIGQANYFNELENVRFAAWHTCIKADFNANAGFIMGVQFQNCWRCITGGMQEWMGDNMFWHSTSGSGADYAYFLFLEGSSASNKAQYNDFEFNAEPGTTLTRIYNFDANTLSNRISGFWQSAELGSDSGSMNRFDDQISRHWVLPKYKFNDIDSNIADDYTLDFFGNGTAAHSGTGQQKIRVWATGGVTRHLEIYSTTGNARIDAVLAGDLELNAADEIALMVPARVQNTVSALYAGAGTPEGVVTAAVGSLYLRTDGGASTSLYVKESGVGNTGWVAK